jgi:hypothetical protein
MEIRDVPDDIVEIFADAAALTQLRDAAMSMAVDYGAAAQKRRQEAWDKVRALYPDWAGKTKMIYNGDRKTVTLKDEAGEE